MARRPALRRSTNRQVMTDENGSKTLARVRLVLWSLVVVAAIGATFIFLNRSPLNTATEFAANFSVETMTGETFTEADLKGTPSLVFFGYTFCPDVCPTTLAETTAWRQALALSEEDLRIIFVTVDPVRDTSEVLRDYVTAFGRPILGLTGDEASIVGIKSAFGAISEKTDVQSETDYLVNHTATVFMVDAEGNLFGTIGFGENADTAKAKIERMVTT